MPWDREGGGGTGRGVKRGLRDVNRADGEFKRGHFEDERDYECRGRGAQGGRGGPLGRLSVEPLSAEEMRLLRSLLRRAGHALKTMALRQMGQLV
jgi:hypothetical protein